MWAACIVAVTAAAAASPPHVVLMMADDLGNYDVGFHNPLAITPNINTLAHEGVILERHYVFHCCGPTRAAMLSGRLPFHVSQHNPNDINSTAGVDLRMTFLPAKLKQAGYATSMIGKSHLGSRSVAHLPINRGFDQHFGFLGGGEDHFTQVSGEDPVVGPLVDLWRDHGPAFGENGTFSGYLYSAEAERVIERHVAAHPEGTSDSKPLFMYLAWHLVHSPLEVPAQYLDPRCADSKNRQLYHGMATALDEGIGNVTRALRKHGMYNNTLIVFASDNGGPLVTTGLSGNNFPLKGGKTTDFEGGTRVAAFIGGGFVPEALRGTTNTAYMHVADWYSTLCGLAGVDPTDDHPGTDIPPIDSIDQWPTILKANATYSDGARQELVLHSAEGSDAALSKVEGDAALIQGRYKVVTGHQGGSGFWSGPVHPNATGPPDPKRNGTACGAFSCCDRCLYDIQSDPTEHVDLRTVKPDVFAQMHARLRKLANSSYQTSYIQPGISCIDANQASTYYKGFRGPQCFVQPPVVPTPAPAPGFQLVGPGGSHCLTGARSLGLEACEPPAGRGTPGTQLELAPQWTVGDAKTGELESLAKTAVVDGLCIKMKEGEGWSCDSPGTNATVVDLGHCASNGGAHKTNFFYLAPRSGTGVLIKSHDCPGLCVARVQAEPADGVHHHGHGLEGELQLQSSATATIGLAPCTDASAGWTKRGGSIDGSVLSS